MSKSRSATDWVHLKFQRAEWQLTLVADIHSTTLTADEWKEQNICYITFNQAARVCRNPTFEKKQQQQTKKS